MLAPKLTDTQVQNKFNELLKKFFKGINSPPLNLNALQDQAQPLLALAKHLTDKQAQPMLDPLLDQIRKETNSTLIETLAEIVHTLPARFTEALAQRVVDTFFKKMDDAITYDGVKLANALQVLPVKLTEAQAQRVVDLLLKSAQDPEKAYDAAGALQNVAPKLTDAQVKQVLDALLVEIDRTTAAGTREKLARALAALAPKLTASQAQSAADALLVNTGNSIRGLTLSAPAIPLQALAPKLSELQARQAALTAKSSLAWAASTEEAIRWAGALAALMDRANHSDSVKALAEAIAYPMAAGEPTDVVLAEIRKQRPDAPAEKGGTRASFEWLAAAYPKVLHPICPEPLQAYASFAKCPLIAGKAEASAGK